VHRSEPPGEGVADVRVGALVTVILLGGAIARVDGVALPHWAWAMVFIAAGLLSAIQIGVTIATLRD